MGIRGLVSVEIQRYEGLDTLIRAAFLRPVQIVRQFISNLETGISPLCRYHSYKGLSSPAGARVHRRIPNIPIGNNKPYILVWQTLGYKGLADIKV